MITLAPEPLTMMPLVPEFRMLASVPSPLRVIDFVIVTAPNPPGSRTEISPPGAVLEIAPANVLQGAVRLHGIDIVADAGNHVRVAWAWSGSRLFRLARRCSPTSSLAEILSAVSFLVSLYLVDVSVGYGANVGRKQ